MSLVGVVLVVLVFPALLWGTVRVADPNGGEPITRSVPAASGDECCCVVGETFATLSKDTCTKTLASKCSADTSKCDQ